MRLARDRFRKWARTVVAAASLLAGFLASGAYAQTSVYIPPPDDVIQAIPPLPPAGDPGIPSPAPAPPPSAPAPMTRDQATAEAKSFGAQKRTENQDLTQAAGAAAQVPGYTGTYPGESSYYDNPDGLSGAGATAASTNEGFGTVHSPRPNVNVTRTDIGRAVDIEKDPEPFLAGENYSSSGSNCVPLPPSGTTNMAEYTCDVGTAVSASNPTCKITLQHNFSDSYQYTCSDVRLQGRLCINQYGMGCFDINYTASSGCGSFAAAGCSVTNSSQNTFYNYSGLNYIQGNYTYKCSADTPYTVTGAPFVINGVTYIGTAAGPSAVPGYINSVQDVSQCADNQLTGCPSGSTLEGTQCVTRQPATLTYVCEAGWTAVGSQCQQTITQPSAIGGFACPNGYGLEGQVCVSRVAATAVYSCNAGWTLQGTQCTRPLTRPADPVLSCPSGWSLVGTMCERVVVNQPASPNYTCPSGWVLAGTTCTLDEVTPATGTAQCSAGYSFDGTNCVQNWSVAATPNYSCSLGWTLNGSQCEISYSYVPVVVPTCSASTYYDEGGTNLCEIDYDLPALCQKPSFEGLTFVRSILDKVDAFQRYCYYQPKMVQTCPSGGVISNNMCVVVYATEPAAVTYTCSSGTLSGTQCVGSDVQPPLGTGYSCPAGCTLSGSQCLRSSSQAASVSYSCDAGLTLSGTTCSGTQSQPAISGLACQPNETLSGTECIGAEVQPAAVSYTCTSGSLVGDQCVSQAEPTAEGFECPVDYVLSAPGFCSKTMTVAAGANYACPSNMMIVGGECVRYSNPVSNRSTECTIDSEVCTDSSPQTRIINGVPVTQSCWEWTRTYSCNKVTTGNSDCSSLEGNAQCVFDHEVCLDDPPSGSGCQVTEKVYKCPSGSTTPNPTQYVCGNDVYCINGDCEPIEREASDEFKDAAVALNALGQANSEFNESTLTLFKGTRETCSHKVFGLSNCCSGKGVPLLTPWLCSSSEQLLDQKDDKGLCHKLGTYCSSKVLGICVTKKDAYCCFQSKISRILQEQGRPQIGKPWGDPKTATCDGFTIFEFQQLDLSVMDFSEVYAEFQDAARLPDEAAALVDIQSKINAYYARGGPAPQ